jgi:ABC-type antimicrobial peptide transport system permease subunit
MDAEDGPWVQVAGVAKDGKYLTIGERSQPYLFLPLAQNYTRKIRMVLRAAGDPRGLAPSLRSAVASLDGDLPVFGVKTMDQFLDRLLSASQAAAGIVGLFGFLALLMASVGLYGLLSFAVHRRTREIGIRMALGAQRRDVLALVVRQGLLLAAAGIVAGLGLALAVTRLVASLLYDVSASDPLTYAVFSLLLAVVAAGACLLPARRATRVDPMVALRYE